MVAKHFITCLGKEDDSRREREELQYMQGGNDEQNKKESTMKVIWVLERRLSR